MSSSASSSSEAEYEKLFDEIEAAFPNAPFSVSISRADFNAIDEPITDEKTIFIYDNRANAYIYSDLPPSYRERLISYLKVDQKEGAPITLRQIIQTMSDSEFYNDALIMQDDHRFLECITLRPESIQCEVFFGS
jgi:hypothetical protein